MDEQPLFVIPERTATLVVDHGDYAGAEMVVSLTVGMADYWRVSRILDAIRDPKVDPDEAEAMVNEAIAIFAKRLRSWNLADPVTHEPVPTTAAGLLTLPSEMVAELIVLWQRWIGKAPPPLAPRSRSGSSTAGSSTAASSRRRRGKKTPAPSSRHTE